MITPGEATLFDRLMRDGATVTEATEIIKLSRHIDAIELAAWEHELRGKGGKWVSSPGGGGGGLPSMPPGESVRIVPRSVPLTRPRPRAAAQGARRAAATGLPPPPKGMNREQQQYVEAAVAVVEGRVSKALQDMTAANNAKMHDQARAEARYLMLRVQRDAEEAKKSKAHHKFAVEAGITIGGLLLAVIEGLIGAPGITQIISAMSPPVIQAVAEWRKRL